jgi:hypothetical protein
LKSPYNIRYGLGAKCNGTNFSVKESLSYYMDFFGRFLHGVKS